MPLVAVRYLQLNSDEWPPALHAGEQLAALVKLLQQAITAALPIEALPNQAQPQGFAQPTSPGPSQHVRACTHHLHRLFICTCDIHSVRVLCDQHCSP